MTNPLSTSWQAILIQNTMENGERKEMKFHAFTEKKVQKMIALKIIILIIALCQMTGHQWTKKCTLLA